MAGFRIDFFKGIRPRVSARKLPAGEAQTAQNSKLGSGDLVAWDEKDSGAAVTDRWYNRTIYRFDNAGTPRWFEFSNIVDVARGPIKGDTKERTYYTGEGDRPRMTFTTIADAGGGGPYPEDYRDLGIPAPPNALQVSPSTLPEDVPIEDRVFSTIQVPAFDIDIAEFTVYPGSGTDNQTWRINAAAASSVAFDLTTGSQLRVKQVLSTTQVVLESATNPGVFARTTNSDKTTLRDWKPMDEQGSSKEADFLGWIIPEAKVTWAKAHQLAIGDVLTITSAPRGNRAMLEFFPGVAEDFFEQSWAAEAGDYDTGSLVYRVRNVRITPAATESLDTVFLLGGSFSYDVDRPASDGGELQDRQYVYTYVSDLGEEGPPSPVSAIVLASENRSVSITGLENVFTSAALDQRQVDNFRLYRTNSSEAGTEFQFVREISVGTSAFPTTQVVDYVPSDELAEVISSTTWFPPDEDMVGILTMPNGMMVGFKDKTLFFCEPFFPHAWPAEYDQAVDYNIVGLAAIGNSIAVMTVGNPYIVSGAHPRNVNVRPLNLKQSCTNKESIAADRDRVYYSSPDGLVEVSANGARLVTEPYVLKKEWQAYSPTTMVGEFHDGKYFGFFAGVANVTQPDAAVVLTGTLVTSSPDEDDLQAGAKTIILTVTGDTWLAAGASFNGSRQAIIDSFVSNKSETNGWNAQRPNIPVGDVVRSSSTAVTITLSALSGFEIEVLETLTSTLPTTVFTGPPASSITAAPTFDIAQNNDFSSKAMWFDGVNTSAAVFGYSTGDADQWRTGSFAGSGTFPYSSATYGQNIGYDPGRDRWIIAVEDSADSNKIKVFSTDDNGTSWVERIIYDFSASYTIREFMFYKEYDVWVLIWDSPAGEPHGAWSDDGGLTWNTTLRLDVDGAYDTVRGTLASYNGYILGTGFNAAGSNVKLLRSANMRAGGSIQNTWDRVTPVFASVTTGQMDGIAAGNDKWIVVARNGSNFTELCWIDATTFVGTSIGTISTAQTKVMIAFGNGIFMLCSDTFQISTVTADDSETTIGNWSAYSSSFGGGNILVENLYYDPGDGVNAGWGWVVVGSTSVSEKSVIYTSADDGASWTLQYTAPTATSIIDSMAFSNVVSDVEKS